jgi:hypothetical protein
MTHASSDTQTTDQYHLGFTMRFPRALSVREDLSVADCITASGTVFHSFGLLSFLLSSIQLSWKLCALRRREKWRMSPSLVSMNVSLIPSVLITYTRKSAKKKHKRTAKVIQHFGLAIQISNKPMFPALCIARIPGRRSQGRSD